MSVDDLMCVILVLAYGVMAYLAGKGDLLNLIPQMLLEKAERVTKARTETVPRCKDCAYAIDEGCGTVCTLYCTMWGADTEPEGFCSYSEERREQ